MAMLTRLLTEILNPAQAFALAIIVASLATDTPLENIYANLEANPFGDAMQTKEGKVRVPQGPGLGVEPDMKIVEKYRQGPVGTIR